MAKDDVCLQGFNLDEAIRLAIGSALMGCGYSLSDCKPAIEADGDLYRLVINNLKLEIVDGRDIDNGVSINNVLGKAYIHRLKGRGKTVSAYMTDKPVDPLVLIGGLYCLISKGTELLMAFNRVMDYLSIDPRIPFRKIHLLVDEYEYFKRLVEAAHRLRDHVETVSKLLGEVFILGCRSNGDAIILFRGVIVDGGTVIISPPIISSTKLYTEYGEKTSSGTCFICSKRIRRDLVSRLGVETISVGDYDCMLGDDPVRLLILIEKKLQASS